jgi:hypothetical protein
MPFFLLFPLIFCVFLELSGCQTPLTDRFNEQVVPEETGPFVATLPLTFPTGLVLSLVDIALVNPVNGALHAPALVGDFWALDSENLSWIPLKTLGTPFVFLGGILFGKQFLPFSDWPQSQWGSKKQEKKASPPSHKNEEEAKTLEEQEKRQENAKEKMKEIQNLERSSYE